MSWLAVFINIIIHGLKGVIVNTTGTGDREDRKQTELRNPQGNSQPTDNQPATSQIVEDRRSETPSRDAEGSDVVQLRDDDARELVRFFKLLSDETRLRILFSLSKTKELHVRALCDLLGQSQPAVSHHLGMLRNAGIVEPRREGKRNYYRIPPSKFQHLLQLLFESLAVEQQPGGSDSDDYRRPKQPR